MRNFKLTMLAAAALVPAALCAQTPSTVPLKESKPGLLARAKVTDAAARQAAMARVPTGAITEAEIESEHGKLIFSYDIKVPGKDGIQEVAVDALTGKVLSVNHESAADEAKEAAEDSAAMKKHS